MTDVQQTSSSPSKKWYAEGICFSCTGCGGCCTGQPGFVWINDQEIDDMANHLGINRFDFMMKYTRRADGKVTLIEEGGYACIFLDNNKCSIYEVRPIQCRTYPFWKSALSSPETFREATASCPGTDLTGTSGKRRFSQAEIEEIAEWSTL